jgi:poly-gamma-glutamate capsule biosynthesis protein CapA/YwtB (metallophosphatase superfamily)
MSPVTLFLCGDVMTGRGIDQILEHPGNAAIHEPYMTSAMGYVDLAESRNGPIPRRAAPSYIWGDALAELERVHPHARLINLETAVTRSDDWCDKGINYRMHPDNAGCLSVAGIDCCALANNHVLDWGTAGLTETLETLAAAGIRTAGAGANGAQAEAPAVLPIDARCRVLVYAAGTPSSGIPERWAATDTTAGVHLLAEYWSESLERLTRNIRAVKQPGDIVVASIHWGGNWGYDIPRGQAQLAHRLIDDGVDLVHGHSSHHPKGIEVYAGKLILYGCGDFINDYEGIRGHEPFQPDLGLMYFPTVESATGRLVRLELVPMRMLRFRSQRASDDEAGWLCSILEREGRRRGTKATLGRDRRIEVQWRSAD